MPVADYESLAETVAGWSDQGHNAYVRCSLLHRQLAAHGRERGEHGRLEGGRLTPGPAGGTGLGEVGVS